MIRIRQGKRLQTPVAFRGTVLLEVIVALTLVAVAGVSLLELTMQAASAAGAARQRAEMVADANAFLESISLWPRADLDRHIGRRREGKFEVLTERPTPTLYHVVIGARESDGGQLHVIVETTLYRQAP